jgi:anti-sigma B factor antagonist
MPSQYPGRARDNRHYHWFVGFEIHPGGHLMSSEGRDVADGTLMVRTAEDGDTRVISLCGELDLANASTAEAALDAALAGDGRVVVDMRELEFIDSTGIALLVAALEHSENGERVRFLPSGSPAVSRVLELTGLADRLPMAETQ